MGDGGAPAAGPWGYLLLTARAMPEERTKMDESAAVGVWLCVVCDGCSRIMGYFGGFKAKGAKCVTNQEEEGIWLVCRGVVRGNRKVTHPATVCTTDLNRGDDTAGALESGKQRRGDREAPQLRLRVAGHCQWQ